MSKRKVMHALWFVDERRVEVREAPLPAPSSGQVLVQTSVSAISAGTEMLVYRGQAPQEMTADDTIEALAGGLAFPLRYGYAAVGAIVEAGDGVSPSLVGKRVFSFQPHGTHFVANADGLILLPDGLADEVATLLPNMETAVSFVMDGRPVIGERILVLGQGIVGLLTTMLLAQMSPAKLVTVDSYALRREKSAELGAHQTLSPVDPLPSDFDLVYELSGNPSVLNQAIAAVGFGGRIVVGSWYGKKQSPLDLGGAFHRNHVELISSQVSALAPRWLGRWTKARRFELAMQQLLMHKPQHLITQQVAFENSAEAYQMLDQTPEQAIQITLNYSHSH